MRAGDPQGFADNVYFPHSWGYADLRDGRSIRAVKLERFVSRLDSESESLRFFLLIRFPPPIDVSCMREGVRVNSIEGENTHPDQHFFHGTARRRRESEDGKKGQNSSFCQMGFYS